MAFLYGLLLVLMIVLLVVVKKTSKISNKKIWYWFLGGFATYFLVEFICIEFFGVDWTQIFFRKA